MKIHDMPQGSLEWWMVRRGIPTASQFKRILTPGGVLSKSAEDYACELIAERNTEAPEESYASRAMMNGIMSEPEARAWYEMDVDLDVRQVGFITNDAGTYGCSPDGLVGAEGGIECKCPMAKTHVSYLVAGKLPDEYKPQVHGVLHVAGLKWLDFLSYCRGFPPLKVRVFPDEYTTLLGQTLDLFVKRLAEIEAKIKGLQSA